MNEWIADAQAIVTTVSLAVGTIKAVKELMKKKEKESETSAAAKQQEETDSK